MNIFSRQSVAVLEHETALQVYFDALFQEEILEKNNTLEPSVKVVEESVPLAINEPTLSDKVLTWATTPFQSLLFSVNGVKMVVPLIQLHSIVNLTAPHNMCRVSDAAWFMGLLPWRGTHIKVIDICKLMAMEIAGLKEFDESVPKRLVLIKDGSWGFVCDDVSEIFTLDSGQVQWRMDRTRRAWLAGTVIEHMCVLLDMDEFALHISSISPAARLMPANYSEDTALFF